MSDASGLDSLVGAVQRNARDVLLVIFAFDGVLVDYQDDRESVRLSAARRDLLDRLVQQPDIVVGVVSGRRVDDLRERMGLGDELFYIGLHGLEIVGPRFTRVQRATFDEHREQVAEIASAVEPSIAKVEGAHLENKEAAIALHTRQAGSADAVWARIHFLNRAADLVNARELRVYRGNHVLELLPNHESVRAEAIRAIQDFIRGPRAREVFTVYVAEDVIDDDGVDAVKSEGVTAVVGRRGRADHAVLRSPDIVEQLVAELTTARSTHHATFRS